MPRGQYDRTKTKEQRAAEKAASGKPAKVAKAAKASPAKKTAGAKRGPKKGWKGKSTASSAATTHTSYVASVDTHFSAISEVRTNLATLALVADKFSDLPILRQEVAANVELLAKLREQAWPTTSEDEEEVEEEPAGNSTTPYQASVPLPPSPVQIPGIPH